MSYQIFVNFEKLSLNVIENEIKMMTNDNLDPIMGDIGAVDNAKFINNLYHGSIAAIFIVNLYESTLNTILHRILNCTDRAIYDKSHDEKLEYICQAKSVELTSIKGVNSYCLLRSITYLRNDIIHYKANDVTFGHFLDEHTKMPLSKNKEPLSKMFTQSYMQKCYDGVIDNIKLICSKCGFILNMDCDIIDSDGHDANCEFIMDSSYITEPEGENQ